MNKKVFSLFSLFSVTKKEAWKWTFNEARVFFSFASVSLDFFPWDILTISCSGRSCYSKELQHHRIKRRVFTKLVSSELHSELKLPWIVYGVFIISEWKTDRESTRRRRKKRERQSEIKRKRKREKKEIEKER